MHAVIRSYSGKGTKALFDLLEKNKGEVESLIRGIKGFVSYSLVRTTRGRFSVSVYQSPRMPAKLVWPDQLSRKAQSCCN